MNKRLIILLVFTMGFAQAAMAQLKVGYVNAARLLEEAPQANMATERLKKEFAPREEERVKMKSDLSDMEDKLRRNADVMTETEARRLEREIIALKRDLRRVEDEFREDLNLRRNEELGKLQELVRRIIETVGKEQNYDLILYEGIAFASDRIDLTGEILTRLEAEIKNQSDGAKK